MPVLYLYCTLSLLFPRINTDRQARAAHDVDDRSVVEALPLVGARAEEPQHPRVLLGHAPEHPLGPPVAFGLVLVLIVNLRGLAVACREKFVRTEECALPDRLGRLAGPSELAERAGGTR